MKNRKMPLAMQIFIALVLAIAAGLLLQNAADFANEYIKPFGTIFLNLLKFIVVPIVLLSILGGVISMSDIKKVGSIGAKTVLYYICTTAFATAVGLAGGRIFEGTFPMISTTDLSYEASETTNLMDTLVNIFPSNCITPFSEASMLQVIVIALMIGFSVILVGQEAESVMQLIGSLNAVFMKCMELILKLSPIGVFCLLCPVVATNGAMIIGSLAMVLLAAYVCYAVHAIVVYSGTVRILAKMSPIEFFKGMLPAMMFAFSSASSVGTLPQMLTIVLTATLASIGTAGVPGSGMVMLTMVLSSVGLPVEGIALVAGVDRIFDMGRTVVNITGDASCAVIVSRIEDRKKAK